MKPYASWPNAPKIGDVYLTERRYCSLSGISRTGMTRPVVEKPCWARKLKTQRSKFKRNSKFQAPKGASITFWQLPISTGLYGVPRARRHSRFSGFYQRPAIEKTVESVFRH